MEIVRGTCGNEPSPSNAKTEPEASESHKILLTLLKISYVLNLIRERGTVLLPRNCQN